MSEQVQYRSRAERHRAEQQGQHPKPPRRKKLGCLYWILGIILVALLAGGAYVAYLYFGARQVAQNIYTPRPTEQQQLRQTAVQINDERKPFSVLLLGVDTGEEGRTEVGRADVMMLLTVNPKKGQTTILSIPRDTRAEIVGQGTEDKLNHAYAFGGVAMSVNSLQKLLNVPIDYTVQVDMGGFEQVIDAIGGIDIAPTATFDEEGFHFDQGVMTHMNGRMALAYVRNRNDTGGDYGRQDRQRQLISAVLSSAKSFDTFVQVQGIFNSLQSIVKTDLNVDQLQTIFLNYRDALGKISSLQLTGTGQTIDGVYYDIPNADSLAEIQRQLRTELEIQ